MAWHVVSVGVNNGTPTLAGLKHAERDADELCGWFRSTFDLRRTSPLRLCRSLTSPGRGTLFRELSTLASTAVSGDSCVIYWAGHSTDHGLVIGEGESAAFAEIAESINSIDVGTRILFIFDVCDGGRVAAEIRDRLEPELAVSSTFVSLDDPGSGVAWDGAFWNGLKDCMSTAAASGARVDTSSSFMNLGAVLDTIRGRPVRVAVIPEHNTWQLPNPKLKVPPRPFVNRASEENLNPETWVGLSGRDSEIARLESWALNGSATHPVAIVTALPGSGKSAVLNHVATTTDFGRPVASAASCRQVVVGDLVRDIGAMFDAAPATVRELVEVLESQVPRPLILLDGLDEAVDPADIGNLIGAVTRVGSRCGEPAAHIIVSTRQSGLDTTGLSGEDGTITIDLDVDPGSVCEAIGQHVERQIRVWKENVPTGGGFRIVRDSVNDPATISGAAESIAEWAGLSFLLAEEILGSVLKDCMDTARSLDDALTPWRRDDQPIRHWKMHDAHMKAVEMRVEWALEGNSTDRENPRQVLKAATETLFQVFAWSLGANGITRPPIADVYRQLWPIVAAGMGLDDWQAHQMDALFKDAWEKTVVDYRVESPLVVDHLGQTAPAYHLRHAVYTDIHRRWLIETVENLGYTAADYGAEAYINSAFLDGLLTGIER